MTTTQHRLTLREAREMLGLSRPELAERADVSVSSIRRIEDGSIHQTKVDVAERLADALALCVHEMVWPNGMTLQGRPPGTGTAISFTTTTTWTMTQTLTITSPERLCPIHFTTLATGTGECGSCVV